MQGERALQMDVQEGSRLQLQAFEAINEVVRSASTDTLPLVGQLVPALLDKLASTLRMQVSSTEAKEHQNDLQVHLACWQLFPTCTWLSCSLQHHEIDTCILPGSHAVLALKSTSGQYLSAKALKACSSL